MFLPIDMENLLSLKVVKLKSKAAAMVKVLNVVGCQRSRW